MIFWWHYILWIVAAASLGFVQPFLFADKLRLSQRMFLVIYVPITSVFLYGYARWTSLDVTTASTANIGIGIVVALLGGAFLVKNVLSQPASQRSHQGQLAVDILWVGGLYGILDALLLSVMPVHAIWQAASLLGATDDLITRVVVGVIALATSLVVTAAYHVGYPEFRGRKPILGPIIGNGVCSLVYLLSGNLLAPVLSHIAMHVAAVFHGPETTIQLPPHYPEASDSRKTASQGT